jgi:ABC-2 type transport system ATP-binding protein
VDAAIAVRAIIRELNRGGCTILLTTHYMREAEELCGRIALINGGRIVAEGTAAQLKAQVKEDEAILVDGLLAPALRQRLAQVPGVLGVAQDGPLCRLLVQDHGTLRPVLRVLADSDCKLEGVKFDEPSLEEVFLMLTQQGLEQGDE